MWQVLHVASLNFQGTSYSLERQGSREGLSGHPVLTAGAPDAAPWVWEGAEVGLGRWGEPTRGSRLLLSASTVVRERGFPAAWTPVRAPTSWSLEVVLVQQPRDSSLTAAAADRCPCSLPSRSYSERFNPELAPSLLLVTPCAPSSGLQSQPASNP